MNFFRFFSYLLLAYFAFVYFWARFGNLHIKEIEAKIFPSLFHWWNENTQDKSCNTKIVPFSYAEQIHDSVKNFTNNSFDFTLWNNISYSDFSVPCFMMDIIPRNNDIDSDLSIIEVQALDRFQKCSLADNLLASRIITKKINGKVYLYILYASNNAELIRYNQLLEAEKTHSDKVGMRNAAPVADSALSEALNLFDSSVCGDTYAQH